MRLAVFSLVVGITACGATPRAGSTTDPAVVRQQIDSLDALFNRWVGEKKIDSIVTQYYWPEATVLNQGAAPASGPDAIRAALQQLMSMGNVTAHIGATSLVVADSVASDMGHYQFEIRSATDSTKVVVSDHGNYVTTFVRRNGVWRALYDINASEIPPPAPK
jgi:ketosteroid isomerase-like protein